jgi:hypothetical protein
MTAKKTAANNTTRSGRRPTGRDKDTSRGGAKRPTPQQAYARHLATRRTGLAWYHALGGLAMDCCPTGTEGRTRKLTDLVAAHPGVTLSNLYRAMKFANQYRRADAARLARAGVGWDKVCHLLTLNKVDRLKAEAELTRVRMTSRQVRLWKDDRFGSGWAHGGRPAAPIPGHRPGVQARALAADCRRLIRRHAVTGEVIARALDALARDQVPTPFETAHYRAALEASRAMLKRGGAMYADLRRIMAACGGVTPVVQTTAA